MIRITFSKNRPPDGSYGKGVAVGTITKTGTRCRAWESLLMRPSLLQEHFGEPTPCSWDIWTSTISGLITQHETRSPDRCPWDSPNVTPLTKRRHHSR